MASLGRPRQALRTAVLVAAAVPIVFAVGVQVSALGDEFGAGKLLWVLLIGIGATVALSDLRIAVAVLALGLAFPFRTKLVLGIEIHTTHVLLALVAVMGMVELSLQRRRVPREFAVPALVMIAGALLAAVAGPDASGALFRAANGVVLPVLAACVAAAVIAARDLRALAVLSAVALAGASAVAMLQAAGRAPSFVVVFEQDRVNGLFLHPNILASFLMLNTMLLVGVAVYGWRRLPLAPLLFVPAIVLGLVALGLTQSRSGLVGLGVGIVVVMGFMVARRQALAILGVLLIGTVAATVAIPQVPESQRAAFVERFQKLNQPGAETGRRLVYQAALDTIREYPLTGVGAQTFTVIINERSAVPGLEAGLGHAHNLALEGYLALGPLGLAGFLWLLVGAVQRFLRLSRSGLAAADPLVAGWAIGALGALAAIVAQNMVDFVFWQVELLVALLILLASAYALTRDSERA